MFRQIEKQIERAARAAINKTAREGVQVARQLSSGKYSLVQLRRMGHPYSKRNPRPPQDRGIINAQTGQFRAAWEYEKSRSYFAGNVAGFIVNQSDRAQWLTGQPTDTMIGRPIENRIRRRIEPVFHFNLETALYRALQ